MSAIIWASPMSARTATPEARKTVYSRLVYSTFSEKAPAINKFTSYRQLAVVILIVHKMKSPHLTGGFLFLCTTILSLNPGSNTEKPKFRARLFSDCKNVVVGSFGYSANINDSSTGIAIVLLNVSIFASGERKPC